MFLDDSDRAMYLKLLTHHCRAASVRITGFCLMRNHVHILAIPHNEDGLAHALGRAHNDYSRWFNMRRGENGHLWQNRYFSCPLDERHQWEALRYVELNPVRAGLTSQAVDWRWSSAAAHRAGADRTGLLDMAEWWWRWTPRGWGEVLQLGLQDAVTIDRIRQSTRTGRPAAGEDFVLRLEATRGRPLRPQRRGRKPRAMVGVELGIA